MKILLGLLFCGFFCFAAPPPALLLSHIKIFGKAPAILACGTGTPTVVGNDSAGMITTGTGTPTVCSITFASTWTTAPHCFVSDETAIIALQVAPAATTLTITAAAAIAVASQLDYFCVNHQ